MAIARLARHAKRPYGLCAKMTAVAIMGLCFIFVWSLFSSSSSSSVTIQRESFDDIAEPEPANNRVSNSKTQSEKKKSEKHESSREDHKVKVESDLESKKDEKKINGSASLSVNEHESREKGKKESSNKKGSARKLPHGMAKNGNSQEESESEESEKGEEEGEVVDGREEAADGQSEGNGDDEGEGGLIETIDEETTEKVEEQSSGSKNAGKKGKIRGPLFDPKAHYSWRLCSTRSKHNYIPCIDIESGIGRLQSYRHTERSCPRTPPMCLVPLPHESYGFPVRWPESKLKVCFSLEFFSGRLMSADVLMWLGSVICLQISYKNVAHPKLDAFTKKNNWLVQSGEYITFPQNQSEFKGGVQHYLESIEEVSFFIFLVSRTKWHLSLRRSYMCIYCYQTVYI